MSKLSEMKCEACRSDAPKVTADEAREWLEQIQDWTMHEVDDVDRLTREFSFKDFAGSLAFTNKVGELAEQEGHHPQIVLEWGQATVSWWTHAINGLHQNDFVLAARTDDIYNQG
ncbi:4a-hydroxytetrahydrobiopterin dehydratase [candidate division GN15 bacterium]|nr:4a-hydroxytetrahydrobiopterin dehydratase [candidate division GN15 bacterium]